MFCFSLSNCPPENVVQRRNILTDVKIRHIWTYCVMRVSEASDFHNSYWLSWKVNMPISDFKMTMTLRWIKLHVHYLQARFRWTQFYTRFSWLCKVGSPIWTWHAGGNVTKAFYLTTSHECSGDVNCIEKLIHSTKMKTASQNVSR